MSNKSRNRQPVNINPPSQDKPEDKPEDTPAVEGQEDMSNNDSASQDTTNQQSHNDQATDKPVVEQTPATPEPVQKQQEAPAAPVSTTEEGFKPVYKVQLDLANYAEAMDRKKSIVPEEGGKWQYSLFTTIKNVLSTKDQEQFNKEWNTALVFFHQNKDGIFNENFLFRFPEQWPGSSTEFTAFRRIAYVMIQTADAKARRKALQDINMELVVQGLKEDQRTRLLNFYQV